MVTEMQFESTDEKVPNHVYALASEASAAAAGSIADLIRWRAGENKACLIGLATGSSPLRLYQEWIRMHREESLSFQNVHVFTIDEFFPLEPEQLQSYGRFLRENLTDQIDIPAENVHAFNPQLPREAIAEHCEAIESLLHEHGGLTCAVLGVSSTGHIASNEPGSGAETRTRMITLHHRTRVDAASDFFGIESVPRHAITMGVGTLLEADRIVMLAFGEGKAKIVARMVEGEMDRSVPASFLQQHNNTTLYLDQAAASRLRHYRQPWRFDSLQWTEELTRRAVIDLANQESKPILKLTDNDYNENGLQDLLAAHGSVHELNLSVFRHLQSTITGWPGGKPESRKKPGDRPGDRDHLFPKRVLLFSPHPDDDVISMGGTLIRLVDQGHEVHIAYQTSGNIAVFDDDALRFAEFAADYCREFGIQAEGLEVLEAHVDRFLRNKRSGQVDSTEVQAIKALIRRGEAREGARKCGVPDDQLHFLDLPFYRTGRVRKQPLSESDLQITMDLMRRIQPHQIYAAGDLSDPHGTHRTCLSAILKSCLNCQEETWYRDCVIWLYRGAWQEWAPHEIEMAVPLSPMEVQRKRVAIFKHESQKDRALFPGTDAREFWQRAEQRNAETARQYDRLGLAEYEAMEGFVRWDGQSGVDL